MLANAAVTAVVATTDIQRARAFYGETLGLAPAGDEVPEGDALFACGGGSTLLVYERATAGDSEATCASFEVEDVPGTAERLRAKGVTFEDFDTPDFKTENGVATFGDHQAAWFRDPDGNILCISH